MLLHLCSRSTKASLSLLQIGVGRTAVVTGATSGIGQGCALRLADAGFSVVAIGRSAARGAAVVEDMKTRGGGQGKHEFISCDAFSLRDIAKTARVGVHSR